MQLRCTVGLLAACSLHAYARECGQNEVEKKDISGCSSVKYTKYMGKQNAIWLGDALHHNPHLKVLDLHHTRFGDDDAIAIANGLHNNTHLKRLHLQNNRIHDDGAVALGKALAKNDALEFLSLSTNGVGDIGAGAIAEGLRANGRLRRLDLYFNLVADDGAKALAEALEVNRGLRILTLDTNRINEAGGLALARAIDSDRHGATASQSIGEISLAYNPLGNVAVNALIEAANANRLLHALKLDQTSVTGPVAATLHEVHNPLMHERHAIAHWLVAHELVGLGHHDASGHHLKWHGGWHSAEGPPLASTLAPAVRELKLYTHAGMRALKHLSREQLMALAPLAALPQSQCDALVTAILLQAKHDAEKEEL